jgi:hypothetical protein
MDARVKPAQDAEFVARSRAISDSIFKQPAEKKPTLRAAIDDALDEQGGIGL